VGRSHGHNRRGALSLTVCTYGDQVLCPFRGSAELAFGHSDSPDHVKHDAQAGDVYILPSGMTHRSLSQSHDFQMVGSYPAGSREWDNCRGGKEVGDDETRRLWGAVREMGSEGQRLKADPVYGHEAGSPLSQFWQVQVS